MTQTYPILTITGDPDGDDVEETGTFEMESADVTPGVRTGALYQSGDGFLQTARAIAFGQRRDQVKLDTGQGATTFQIEFRGWDGENADYQWGDSAAASLTATSATGQNPFEQISILLRYLNEVNIDSENPATLEWGEFSTGGVYDPVTVAPEDPTFPTRRDEPNTFDGTLTLVSTADLSEQIGRARQFF